MIKIISKTWQAPDTSIVICFLKGIKIFQILSVLGS